MQYVRMKNNATMETSGITDYSAHNEKSQSHSTKTIYTHTLIHIHTYTYTHTQSKLSGPHRSLCFKLVSRALLD